MRYIIPSLIPLLSLYAKAEQLETNDIHSMLTGEDDFTAKQKIAMFSGDIKTNNLSENTYDPDRKVFDLKKVSATRCLKCNEPKTAMIPENLSEEDFKQWIEKNNSTKLWEYMQMKLDNKLGMTLGDQDIDKPHYRKRRDIDDTPHIRKPRMVNPRPDPRFPSYTVSLETVRESAGLSTCTGTILDESVIMTAAHCLISRESRTFEAPRLDQLYQIEEIKINLGVIERNMVNFSKRNFRHKHERQIVLNLKRMSRGDINNMIKINQHWTTSLADKRVFGLKHGDIALIKLPKDKHIIPSKDLKVKPVHLYAPGWHCPMDYEIFTEEFDFKVPGKNKLEGVGYGRTVGGYSTDYGFGYNYFKTIDKKAAKEQIRNMGWHGEENLTNVKDMFFAIGKPHNTRVSQVCSGDSGGPLFFSAPLLEAKNNTLYQYHQLSQGGITCWVDGSCRQNFNGFMEVAHYVDWIRKNLDLDVWKKVEDRIVPSKTNVELYIQHRDAIKKWRKDNPE